MRQQGGRRQGTEWPRGRERHWEWPPRRNRLPVVAGRGAAALFGLALIVMSGMILWATVGPGSVPGVFTPTGCATASHAGESGKGCYGAFRSDDGRTVDRDAVYNGTSTIGVPLPVRREMSGAFEATGLHAYAGAATAAAAGLALTASSLARLRGRRRRRLRPLPRPRFRAGRPPGPPPPATGSPAGCSARTGRRSAGRTSP